jgi:hypothetical protein
MTERGDLSLEARDDLARHWRAARFLYDRTGAVPAEPDGPVDSEFPRVKMGAKVGAYFAVLTESSARAMLRRKARLSARTAKPSVQ